MPRDPKPGPAIPGESFRLGGRKPATPTCRDEIIAALRVLMERHGDRPFAVSEVYAEMIARGTGYAELTVYKTMQRMKAAARRSPLARLERVGRAGFHFVDSSA